MVPAIAQATTKGRRSQEGLFNVRVNTAIEVAVARQHRSGMKPRLSTSFSHRVERAAHAVTGGAGKANYAEAEFFQLG